MPYRNNPGHWRFRAEEARMVADEMTDEGARAIMWRIALEYYRLAKLAEERLAGQEATERKTWNRYSVRVIATAPHSVPRQKREPRPSTSGPGILVVVTGNFLHEHHDPEPQGGIINSHERFD